MNKEKKIAGLRGSSLRFPPFPRQEKDTRTEKQREGDSDIQKYVRDRA